MMLEKRLQEIITDCKRAQISKRDFLDMAKTLYEDNK